MEVLSVAQQKKQLPMAILAILREHTDAKKHIRQMPIMKLLEEEHSLTATRKTVRKNLAALQQAGYPVKFNKGWYYDHLMTAEELDYLSACVMASDIPDDRRTVLLERLSTMAGPQHAPAAGNSAYAPVNPAFFAVANDLAGAIAKGRKVTLVMDAPAGEKAARLRVTPCHLARQNGRSVLVCIKDGEETAREIPVNGIAGVRVLKQAAASPEEQAQAE